MTAYSLPFAPKTQPRAAQLEALRRSHGQYAFAYFMEMRTGKTKTTLDDAAREFTGGHIDCLLVIAPNGVHRQWVTDAAPEHMAVPWVGSFYEAQAKVGYKREFDNVLNYKGNKIKILAFNIESTTTDKGQDLIWEILRTQRCMLVVDESDLIKSPKAKCTKFLIKAGKMAAFKRILTGTPITQNILGLYPQFQFLSDSILGFRTYTGFRSRYAIMEQRRTKNNRKGFYDHVVGYRNVDELEKKVAPYVYRLRAEDCHDLPEKVFMKLPVELTSQQERMYREMIEDAVTSLVPPPDTSVSPEQYLQWYLDNDKLEASNALTKLLRAQQVLGGHVKTVDDQIKAISHNRLKTLLDFLPQVNGKAIIWAKFKPEIYEIAAAVEREYGPGSVVQFHGDIEEVSRETSKQLFQNPLSRAKYLVGQPRAGGVGHTFDAADTVIFYSNDYSARVRWQAEVRASNVGKKSIAIIDLVAPGTIDEGILKALDTCRAQADTFNWEAE